MLAILFFKEKFVTENRKHAIAIVVMHQVLIARYFGNMDAMDSGAIADAGFMQGPIQPLTTKLRNLMNCLVCGTITINHHSPSEGALAYQWLMLYFTREDLQINNNFRRSIGNQAKRLGISETQLIEFYRLILVEIVNHELRQVIDEIPLKRRG